MKKSEILSQLDAYKLAYNALTELYKTDENKKFVHHLIYAFSVDHRFILFSKSTIFDCLSHSVILPIHTNDRPADKALIDQYTELKDLDKESEEYLSKLKVLDKQLESYVRDNSLTRIAVRSDKTNKLLGLDEYQALVDFINDQIQSGNKVISSMMRVTSKNKTKSNKKSKKADPIDFNKSIELLKAKFGCK